jgi:Outer membrane protein beta-barrel domain
MRAALALALVLGTASTAAADGIYFTEALGGSSVGNDLGHDITDAMRIRLSVGYRLNKSWAVEGWFAGDIGTTMNIDGQGYAARCVECNDVAPPDYGYHRSSSMTSAGIDVKYLRPLGDRFEVYLRGSLGKGWLDADDYSGRGFGIGAGAQIKGKVPAIGFLFWPLFFTNWGPKVTAALFVDTGADFYRLHRHGDLDNTDTRDGSFNRFTIGWAVGADF